MLVNPAIIVKLPFLPTLTSFGRDSFPSLPAAGGFI